MNPKFKINDKVLTKCSGCWGGLHGKIDRITYHESWNRFYYQVWTNMDMGLGWFNENELIKI